MNYELAYKIGFHPWEDAADEESFTTQINALFAREEDGRESPYGRALDLGTGSGIWATALAQRGWDVTAIDNVDKALDRARARLDTEGADVNLMRGDVTDLVGSGVGDGFRFLLDTGTFHDFDPPEQLAMGRGIDAVAAPDATVLLLCWPRRRRPLIRGVDHDEIHAAFPSWVVTDIEPSALELPKPLELILRPDEHWFRLRRR